MSERPTAYLVDGSAFVFRAFYAIRQELTTSNGTPTNAVFGFKNMLQKLMRQEQPDYLAVVFDERGPTFRHEADPTYKANRKRMPDELAVQLPWIHRLVEAHNIPKLSLQGFEADDIIGTLSHRLEAQGLDVVLVSGDKDFCQLVTPHVTIFDPMKDQRVGEAEVVERFGVEPARVIEVLGLMGDASDNVPGVPGIGEKTAKKLLATYGTIEELLSRADEIKQKKQRESLIEHAESARHSRQQVTIHMDVPIDIGLEALKFEPPDTDALRTLYEELEFKSELQSLGVAAAPEPTVEKQYRAIMTRDDLDAEIATLQQADGFAIDTETTSQDPMVAELVGISLAHKPHEAVYIPVAHRYAGAPPQLGRAEVLERLRPLLEDPRRPKYGQNIKYDLIVLERHGVRMRGLAFDTMVAGYLLNPSRRANNLDALAKEYLHYTPTSYEDVAGKGAKQITFDQVDIERATAYSSEDSDVAALLVECQKPKLADHQLERLFQEVEMPLIEVLADLEMRGITVDADYLQDMSERLQIRMDALMEDIYSLAGEEFNINSSQQLQKILFDKLKLPPGKKTKTGYSTDVSVLEQLAFEHELPEHILDYRHLAKMKSTYIDALPQLIHPETGRIHTSLNQTITETGRLSSSNPNLQNIPIRSDLGRQIRRAFVAAPGHRLISADYSQIELRLLAHFTHDPVLTEAFRQGQDIHTRTAMDVFTVDESAVDGDMRRMAKTVNFGIIYGLSPFGLASRLHITNEEARNYINNYFARYPLVKSYLDGIIEEAREQGYVTTLMQRRRYLPEMNNRNRQVREAAERTAINMPFQGSAADLIKLAMVQLHHQIKTENLPCHMLLQIHDELLFEIPEAAVDEMVPRIKEAMEHVWDLEVPLTVDVGQGDNWAQAH
ncbi:DNA polymerase I [Candidatus Entotheonella palauensis]|uniref:DNA polymerase I n=1 Tax=Candidatus Entotheonella palauensis TaxID=93172 RepID=UPI000B7CA0D6|nr:DNA polymerase I [Candidatus Entotheonella palauensis]